MNKKAFKFDLLIGIVVILIFIGFSHLNLSFFERMEEFIYDKEIKYSSSEKQSGSKIVLIDIDDKSLIKIGPWPWPRAVIADMVNLLKKNSVALIGLNIPLNKKESNQGLKEIRAFHEKFNAYPFKEKDAPLSAWILENLNHLEKNLNNDRKLISSVRQSGNIILPVSARPGNSKRRNAPPSLLVKNFLTSDNIPDTTEKRFSTDKLLLPFTALGQSVLGLGHDNLTLEGNIIGRSHPLFMIYKGFILPSFPLRLAIAYLKQEPKKVLAGENQIKLKNYSIPTIKGEMLIKFEKKTFSRLSFADLLHTKNPPLPLKGKIALIGMNFKDSRHFQTSVSPEMSEGELTAYILDNILNRAFIKRPPLIANIEILLILLLGGFAVFIFPRIGQTGRLCLMLGLTLLILTAGVLLISMSGIWLKTGYTSGCIIVIWLVVSIKQFLTAEKMTKEAIETNRLLGLSFQSQGLLDLSFDKFRKLPLSNETKDLIYNLGLEFEQKRQINKALAAYEYISKGGSYRDLNDRIPKLKESDKSSTLGSHEGIKDPNILANADIATRSKVGRYEIMGELGKGSMGIVYKALDPKINRLLAIKTIRFSDEFEEDVLQEIKERFFREAEIAGQLSHPSIVTIHDVGDDRDLTYMAMEYLEGKDLEKHIKKTDLLPFRKVLDLITQVADALDFAHKAKVIHRDIKPANIMLLNKGMIKVTDFGIAKAISSSRTKTGVILGTPNYMSPEQIMGQKIGPQSDIFSLGVVFFQLLTGELPFHGDNLSNLLYQITQVKHPSVKSVNPRLPKACEQIIDKALAKAPKDRFKKASDMGNIIRLLASKIDQLKKGP